MKNRHEKEQKSLVFFQKWAQSYDSFIFGFWMRYIQRKTVEQLTLSEDMRVLDIACGTGYALQLLKTHNPKIQLFGLYFSSKMLAIARKKLPSPVVLKMGSADAMPFRHGFFDAIICTEAFHQ
ncbi:methyltransferase domain-containing protein [Candidatus Woesearchaeota archaeon]|nr:methyltransferase domain-containing protein [Candidatus Woesearchaeota archaeon]